MKRKKFKIKAGQYGLNLGEKTLILGIVNSTPDSFSQDGTWKEKERDGYRLAVKRAVRLARDGADMIDIGGESTRPGAAVVPVDVEQKRVVPVIKHLVDRRIDVPISIDSYKRPVIKAALDAGATIVNNIMGVKPNRSLLKMVRDYKAAIVLMHIKGTPRTMQKKVCYTDVILDIVQSLRLSIDTCLDVGITEDRIIIDPGIGFGKTVEHNLTIINNIDRFVKELKHPLLVGPSRKSFIGHVLNKDVSRRLTGTIASVCASIMRGAHIVRVHDVKQIAETVRMMDSILKESVQSS
ncbi:MAG: dihydropteroate synthase [Candidatus Omnitrophica bacterium]|nr:dihydropteroate synthase [Candidatus Omnitrophota bacterium]